MHLKYCVFLQKSCAKTEDSKIFTENSNRAHGTF